MIVQKKHLIARKLSNKFKEDLITTHPDLIRYPLEYESLKITIQEHFNIIIEEIPNLKIKKVKSILYKFNLDFPSKEYDDYLDLAGLMIAYDNVAFIFIEENDSEERKKFSLLHEVSHFLNEYYKIKLKSKDNQTIPLFDELTKPNSTIMVAKRCTKNDVFTQTYGSKENEISSDTNLRLLKKLRAEKNAKEENLKERVCDWFSAEVLMPIDLLKQLEIKWTNENYTLNDMIESIQKLFRVSKQAAKVRANELKLGNIDNQIFK